MSAGTAVAQANQTPLVTAHRDGLSWWTRDMLLDTPTKQVWQWEPEETAKFMTLVEGMEPYSQLFIDNHITGIRLLRMNEQRMVQLGINSQGARHHLVDEIKVVRKWGVSKHVHWYVTDEDLQAGNCLEGLIDGLTELVRGIAEGAVGVLYEPAKAVRQEGSDGFCGGVGLGIAGVLFRPLGGVCDCLRCFSDGIKNTPTMLDDDEELAEALKEKVMKEIEEKEERRKDGKKVKKPVTIDDDYPKHIGRGIQQAFIRLWLGVYFGITVFLTATCSGGGKGVFKGMTSLIFRPIAGILDFVQRIFEGCVNTPDYCFDLCQKKDFRQRDALIGSDLWWERQADPAGAAMMGLGVQGSAHNVGLSSGATNINAETGPLATNTLAGMQANAQDGIDDRTTSSHFEKQVAEARAGAVGAADQV